MPLRASSLLISALSTKTEGRKPHLAKENAWGQPVFRPPALAHPPIARDPVLFRTPATSATGGR